MTSTFSYIWKVKHAFCRKFIVQLQFNFKRRWNLEFYTFFMELESHWCARIFLWLFPEPQTRNASVPSSLDPEISCNYFQNPPNCNFMANYIQNLIKWLFANIFKMCVLNFKKISVKQLCQSVLFNEIIVCNFLRRHLVIPDFFEFYKIFKNASFI